MIVWPGLRRSVSAISRLFNSAAFFAPLTHSAIPVRAAPGTTASFTRATTKTWTNNDGYLVTGLAGEIGFVGARRVRNLVNTTSEDFTNAAWAKVNTTAVANQAVSPNGALTADLVYPTTTGGVRYVWQNPSVSGLVAGASLLESVYVKSAGKSWVCLGLPGTGANEGVYFDIANGVVGTVKSGALNPTITDVGDGWYRCSLGHIDTSGGTAFVIINVVDADNSLTVTTNGTDGVYLWGAQIEDVTAQTTQTAGEYVSVGVESAPYYHGSFVDGVKCFPTDLSGNPIPSTTLLGHQAQGARTNLCLQSNAFTTTWLTVATPSPTQNIVGPDGGTTAWTMTDNDAGNNEAVYQDITLTAAAYTFSVFVKKTTGAQTSYPVISWYNAALEIQLGTIDTSNGVLTEWTAYTGFTMAAGRSSRISSYNDNFWRIELTKTGTAAAHTCALYPAGALTATKSTGVLDAAAQGSAVFYGAQVELGSFASSYIPTTTIAVARNADVLTYSGGDVPNLKTLMAGFRREVGVSSAGWAVALSDGTVSNYESISAVSATQARFLGVTGGATQWDVIPSYTAGTTSKAAFSAATNDIKMAKDGVAQTQDTSATVPTVTQLDVGHVAGSFQLNGNVGPIYGWTRNLSQSEENAVTA